MADTEAASAISGASVRRGDRVFRGLSRGAGTMVLVIMAAIASSLIPPPTMLPEPSSIPPAATSAS